MARLGWDEDYAPPGWDHHTYRAYNGGRPDVVFMAYDPGCVDRPYDPSEGAHVSDFDAGTAAARHEAAAREQQRAGGV